MKKDGLFQKERFSFLFQLSMGRLIPETPPVRLPLIAGVETTKYLVIGFSAHLQNVFHLGGTHGRQNRGKGGRSREKSHSRRCVRPDPLREQTQDLSHR